MEEILIYIRNEEDFLKIREMSGRLGVRTTRLSDQDLSQQLITVIAKNSPGADGAGPGQKIPNGSSSQIPPLYSQPDILIFCQFSQNDVFGFIKRCREEGIALPGLKAVATPYNISWTVYELTQELQRERDELNKNR